MGFANCNLDENFDIGWVDKTEIPDHPYKTKNWVASADMCWVVLSECSRYKNFEIKIKQLKPLILVEPTECICNFYGDFDAPYVSEYQFSGKIDKTKRLDIHQTHFSKGMLPKLVLSKRLNVLIQQHFEKISEIMKEIKILNKPSLENYYKNYFNKYIHHLENKFFNRFPEKMI